MAVFIYNLNNCKNLKFKEATSLYPHTINASNKKFEKFRSPYEAVILY